MRRCEIARARARATRRIRALRARDWTSGVRLLLLVVGAVWLALLALFAMPSASPAARNQRATDEDDRVQHGQVILGRPATRVRSAQTVRGSRYLSTLLILALVGAAFVAGLAGGALIWGGHSKRSSSSSSHASSAPAASSSGAAGTRSRAAAAGTGSNAP